MACTVGLANHHLSKEEPVSIEAWTAFIDALIHSLSTLFWGAAGGWMLRGAADRRRARREYR